MYPILKALIIVTSLAKHVSPQIPKQPTFFSVDCDKDNGVYASNSTYHRNLIQVLFDLTNRSSTSLSYNSSSGGGDEDPATAYGQYYCRGDLTAEFCHKCVMSAATYAMTEDICVGVQAAVVWYRECTLRFENESNVGVWDSSWTPEYSWSGQTVLDSKFEKVLSGLMETLVKKAAYGGDPLEFATGEGKVSEYETVYCLVQCSPDVRGNKCDDCLSAAIKYQADNFSRLDHEEVLLFYPECQLRYNTAPFYNTVLSSVTSLPPFAAPSGKRSGNSTTKTIVAVVAGSLFVLLIIVACFIFIRKRKLYRNLLPNNLADGDDNITNIESLQFSFSTIRAATSNFSDANKLGEGGFGVVYKGTLPDNGKKIAVKRLAGNSSQGEDEFKTEVTLLAKLQHRNLVRLLGFCFHNKERLLVYEFVLNSSLDKFLFGAARHAHLDWKTRYKIIRGIARGIQYLHEDSRLRIIHRDLKASNILLDKEMCPKIADFGTARLFQIDQTHSNTRRIVGTYGYMAPEYVLHGKFSAKSDVYSFGALLLEIVSGKKCTTLFSEEISGSLISLIWRKWTEGKPLEVVDSSITDCSESEILRCIHIGLLCVQDNMVDRPTMSSVVLMMSSESVALALPSQPAYMMTSNMPLNTEDANWIVDKDTDLESITELNVR